MSWSLPAAPPPPPERRGSMQLSSAGDVPWPCRLAVVVAESCPTVCDSVVCPWDSPEMEELAEHGVFLPPNMQGLTDEQIEELKLKDEWGEKCIPSGGSVFKKDDVGRRNGQAPNEKMKQVIKKTIEEAKAIISKKQVEANVCVTMEMVNDALDQLRGAVMIVYPMGLPPYDPIRMEFENKEDLSGTQAGLNVIKESEAQLWWAAKELRRTKKLSDYVGKNEKTKIIVKIQQEVGGGQLGIGAAEDPCSFCLLTPSSGA
ncbi:cilia- and flagella-associated protein 298 isoform X4 [Odocoileus virginianus]|uniref:Cilia- and flagella-associated protein 298 isoform X4 n=1 Tax=Odocoileus virginianus TaxID=9874 RepID=A0ABM4H6S7_ODOVR